MSETLNFSLPYLASAQAQKHVTMNEALARLDALAAPTALSSDTEAPATAEAGDAYIVPVGAGGPWFERDGHLAFWVNDGWSFAAPRPGWRVWVIDRDEPAIWTGSAWIFSLSGPSRSGAATKTGLLIGDVALTSGSTVDSALIIPDRAVVVGVTALVTETITGVSGWRLGVASSTNRYGSNIGIEAGSTSNGVTGAPVAYYADTPLLVDAEGGAFTGGSLRLAVHFLTLTPPTSA